MPTYKPRQVIRDLLKKGCTKIKNNNGSHQKIQNPNGTATTVVTTNRELSDYEVKNIYEQLGLEWKK